MLYNRSCKAVARLCQPHNAPPPAPPVHFVLGARPRHCDHDSTRTQAQALDDVPDIFGSMAELAARDAGRETVVADGDLLVYELVGEVVRALSHGSDKDTDTLLGR